MTALRAQVETALGVAVEGWAPVGGGQVGTVVRCRLATGEQVIAKTSPGGGLEVEGGMVRHLAEHSELPVPEVLYASSELLIEGYVESDGRRSEASDRHAGELLAELHEVGAERFGFSGPTLLGPFRLENGWWESWPSFYAEQRLLPLAEIAARRGALPDGLRRGVERLAASLPERFDTEPNPSLVHGDVWSGNVLVRGDRVVAFLDPSVHYADAEVELAFIDLFHTFGPSFYRAYQEVHPIDPGYGAWRRNLYQVAPLLVHVALFGGGYVGALRERLEDLGVAGPSSAR